MKRKINVNREKLSSEDILAKKNFSEVMANYSVVVKPPFFKTPWFMTTVAVATVGVVVSVVLYTQNNNNTSDTAQAGPVDKEVAKEQPNTDNEFYYPDDTPCINPPLKSVEQDYTSYNVDATKGAKLDYKSGTKIDVPKDAFKDDEGNVVEGDVEIRYREFHDPLDFFLSGIPMTYDSSDTRFHFESAGMLEILAYKNGVPVHANADNPINIEMESGQEGTHFNLYSLDTTARNWKFEGKDKVTNHHEGELLADASSFELTPEQKVEFDKEIKELEKKKETVEAVKQDWEVAKNKTKKFAKKNSPLKPKKVDKDKNHFNIDSDAKEFPELAMYKGSQFEVGKENKDFNKDEAYNTVWDDATLSENVHNVSYKITLTKGDLKRSFIVYPVFDGEDFTAAMKVYEKKFAAYQTKLDQRKVEDEKKKVAYEAKLADWERERLAQQSRWEEQRKQMAERAKNIAKVASTSSKVTRAFTISGFGVYNCDNPKALPSGQMVKANFVDKSGNNLVFNRVFLVDKNMNGMYTYYQQKFHRFKFNPHAENMIWAVTSDNKLAVFTTEDFAKIPQKNGDQDFTMTTTDEQFANTKQVRKFLGI
jgi:hypothetical protein